VEQDVEFVIGLRPTNAEAGFGEVRGTGDDRAGFVLVKALWPEDVNFCVKVLRRMSPDVNPLGGNVFDELQPGDE